MYIKILFLVLLPVALLERGQLPGQDFQSKSMFQSLTLVALFGI